MIAFGVMLVRRDEISNSNFMNWRFKVIAPVVGALFIIIGFLLARAQWVVSSQQVPAKTVQALSPILMRDYIIPFEVAAILLTVALTGALVLVKEVKANGDRS
jgi:NADH-quinone oxidoreductase subunit J